MNRFVRTPILRRGVQRAAGIFVAAALAGAAQAADYALCIGVNNYTGLRPGSSLRGCVPDARLMEAKLRSLGFRDVKLLTDAQATKQGILSAIQALGSQVHASDRVVIYFAGHGTISTNGQSVILPSDARDTTENFDIQVDELYTIVKSMGAGAKTIVLDSCHSGGMIRDVKGLKSWKNRTPRFYVRSNILNKSAKRGGVRDTKAWQEDDANDADNLGKVVGDNTGVTYWTAALKTQVAAETSMGGESHGVFTYFFAQNLRSNADVWWNVAVATTEKVLSSTDNEQKPILYPASVFKQPIFGPGGGAPPPAPKPINLAGVYSLSAPDPSKVLLTRFPEGTQVAVGSANYFEVKAGTDGFLVILSRDPKESLEVLWPRKGELALAQVKAGQVVRIPSTEGRVMRPNVEGTDYLKAILFTDEASVRKMLQPFVGGRSVKVREAVRSWEESEATIAAPFYTSETITLIVPKTGTAQ